MSELFSEKGTVEPTINSEEFAWRMAVVDDLKAIQRKQRRDFAFLFACSVIFPLLAVELFT